MLLTFLMLTAIFCTSGQSENRFEKPIRLTNFRLANKLHNAANPGEKNYLVSPYAIQLALSMLYLGTNLNSQTSKQIKAHGLDLGTNQLEGMKGFYMKSLIHSLTDDSPIIHDQDDEYESDPTVLRARLFLAINKQYNVDPNYAAAIRRFSNNASSVIRDDFGKYGQHVINTINERISNLTDNMIQNFLPPGSLNDDTVLSLINAIYLKAEWHQDAGLSRIWRKKAFRLEGGTTKYLLMFEGTVRAPYFEDEKFQLIKLPMKGDDYRQFWMYIVLPKVEDGRNFLSPLKTFVKRMISSI
uniref:Serpin domain-containing protein n=1 Tax=Romanomermis culicivorax TaxID=13658 RepID=A0A915L2D5_ROMCU